MKKQMLCVLALILAMSGCSKEKLVLKDEKFVFEYGEKVTADPAFYLADETDSGILEKTSAEIVNPEQALILDDQRIVSIDEDGRAEKYLEVGEVILRLIYDNGESKEVLLLVEDTVMPEMIDFMDEIRVEKDALDVDFNRYFACEDLSGCTIKAHDEDVDLLAVGEYEMKVEAQDGHKNTVEKNVKVNVVSLDDALQNGVTSTLDGIVYQSEAMIQKKQEEDQKENQKENQTSPSQPSLTKPQNPSPAEPITSQPEAPSSKYIDSYAKEVLNLVNEERKKAGLEPLIWDAQLAAAANIRAKEIAVSFSHTRPDGSSCFSAVGNMNDYMTLGENIAYGYQSSTSVMNGWMNSQGHRENILNSSFTCLGVSCYLDENGTYQWVQIFGG